MSNGGGRKEVFLLELICRTSTHTSQLGENLHNNFVDLVRFDSQGKIAQIKEFMDSEHVHRHVDAHEKKQKQADK